MHFSSRQYADVFVAAPVGRVDHDAAADLERALLPLLPQSGSAGQGLILDFAGVDYISSVGLRALMIAAKQTHARAARIAVAALQPVVAEIFAISRFENVVEVFPSVRDALQEFSAPGLAAFDAT